MPVACPSGGGSTLHWDVLALWSRRPGRAARAPRPAATSPRRRRRLGGGPRAAGRGRRAARQPRALPGRADRTGCRSGTSTHLRGRALRDDRRAGAALQHRVPAARSGRHGAAGRGPAAAAGAGPARPLADRRRGRRGHERLDHGAAGRDARGWSERGPRRGVARWPDATLRASSRRWSSRGPARPVLREVARRAASASAGRPCVAVGSHDTAPPSPRCRWPTPRRRLHLLGHVVARRARARRPGAHRGEPARRTSPTSSASTAPCATCATWHGLWLLQESMRTWAAEGGRQDLADPARRRRRRARRCAASSTSTTRPSSRLATCPPGSPTPPGDSGSPCRETRRP